MLQIEKVTTDVEKRVSEVLKFIQSKTRIQKGSKKALLGLVNDLHEQCHMLSSVIGDRIDVSAGEPRCRNGKPYSVSPASSSDIEYYSSEEIGNSAGELNLGVEISSSGVVDRKHRSEALSSDYARAMKNLQEAEVKSQNIRNEMNDKEKVVSAWRKQLEQQMSEVKAELQTQCDVNGDLKEQISKQANKAKETEERNNWLCSQNSELELMLKEKDNEVSNLTKKIRENEKQLTARIEDLKIQVRNLQDDVDSLRARNRDLAGSKEGKRNEDQLKSLMDQVNATQHELTSLRKQEKMLQSQVDTKTNETLQTQIQIKRLQEESARYVKVERMILQEKEEFQTKAENLKQEVKSLNKEKNVLANRLQSLLHKKSRTKLQIDEEIQSTRTNSDFDGKKIIEEHEDVIRRLTAENKDQQRLLNEQKHTIDKFMEDQKIFRRWSFGSTKDVKINSRLLERKMEELAEDFRMKMEDHIRLLYRRIHVAEQIHIESKKSWDNTQVAESGETRVLLKTIFEKMKNMKPGFAKSDEAIKKLAEADNFLTRASILTDEIQYARTWVSDKNNKVKQLNDEIKTISAQLECSKAQESLSKEKLSKLEAKLAEEGTEKLELMKVSAKLDTKVKELDLDVKAKNEELLSLREEKREAIRQLCILMDYQRTQYVDLKRSVSLITLKP